MSGVHTARLLDTPEKVASAIRQARRDRGMTQAQLAEAAGTGRRFVVDLEAGHPTAHLGKTLIVLEALGDHGRGTPLPTAAIWRR